jgi:hypothetical protein
LCEWSNSKLRNFKRDPAFEELYFERRGKISRNCLKKPCLLPVWVYTFGACGAMYLSAT